MLVIDIADDLLKHVLDRQKPGHTPVLVNHDRHVVVAVAKFLEQRIETLRLRNHDRRAQQPPYRDVLRRIAAEVAQEVLREQHAEHLVAILADHGEARMPGLDDYRQHVVEALLDVDDDHL